VDVEWETLSLQRVRQLEAALEARGKGVRLPGSNALTQHHSWLYRFFEPYELEVEAT
jgi:hypothetical protein